MALSEIARKFLDRWPYDYDDGEFTPHCRIIAFGVVYSGARIALSVHENRRLRVWALPVAKCSHSSSSSIS
jgi:hypothetical protein